MKNIIVYVSSRNNYDMLEQEVLKNVHLDGCEFINVDDHSDESEKAKGKSICSKNNIVFLENKSRGVQFATQTLIDFISTNRPECKWIVCFQHDNYPITKDFFIRISQLEKKGLLDEFGALGFNVLDDGRYTGKSLKDFNEGSKPLGILGLCHLSIRDARARWLCPERNELIKKHPDFWRKPFIIEIPMWAAVGINVSKWKQFVRPTTDYQFHLWFPDAMMQLNKKNCPCLVLPDLYCLNRQSLKKKYGIPANSAQAAQKGDKYHFGEYGPHLKNFQKRWGWDYEDVRTFKKIRGKYKGTLIYDFYRHDMGRGPLRTFDFGSY